MPLDSRPPEGAYSGDYAREAYRAGYRAGGLALLAELDTARLTDEIAGTRPIDDLARRLRRELEQR